MSSMLCKIRGCRRKHGRSWKAWANLLALVGQSKQSTGLALELVGLQRGGGRSRRRHRAENRGAETERGGGAGGRRRPNRRGLPFPAWERPPQTPPHPPPLQAPSSPIDP